MKGLRSSPFFVYIRASMMHSSAVKLGFLSFFSYIVFSFPVDATAQKKVVAQPKPQTSASKPKSLKKNKPVKFITPKLIPIETDAENPPMLATDYGLITGNADVDYGMSRSDFASYVNPMIGTGGHGHTFPGAVWPFGMVQLSPDTRTDASWDGCGGYYYDDTFIYGFSHTHLSGTGVSDYGDVLFQPKVGNSSFNPLKYRSKFNHDNEDAKPGYYSNTLLDNDVRVELTAHQRVGAHRYTFRKSKSHFNDSIFVVVDLKHRDYLLGHQLDVETGGQIVKGYRRSKAWANDQSVFFFSYFSKKILSVQYNENKSVAILYFGQLNDSNQQKFVLEAYVGISFTSLNGAEKNISPIIKKASTGQYWVAQSFSDIRILSKNAWNSELSKINVLNSNSSIGTKSTDFIKFYTALYHCMIHPSLASDEDLKYRGRDQQIHQGTRPYYSVFSLWDTYRALHPLLTIIDRKRTSDFINTFLLQYVQGGRLPVWELGSCETDCMIGYHSVSVIADALMKGIENIDVDLALEAMIHSSNRKEESYFMKVNHQGRLQKSAFKNDYIDVKSESESVSKSLEYAYNDWCIAQVIQKYQLGTKNSDQKWADLNTEMLRRSNRWQHYLDPETKYMRPKVNGEWISPFEPREVNNHFTEANSFQYSFYVPHQIELWKTYLGGDQVLERQLDTLFSTTSKTTGREQSDISGLIGQYAHGNEPSHHMVYLYNYCNRPDKTQKLVRRIWNNFYQNSPDGLIGNEDCGQMSAWAVMSALGIYPVTPGNNHYAVGVPFFDQITVKLDPTKESQRNTFKVKVYPRLFMNNVFGVVNQYDTTKNIYSMFISHNDLYQSDVSFSIINQLKNPKYEAPAFKSDAVNYSIPVPIIKGDRIFTSAKHQIQVVPSDFSFINSSKPEMKFQVEILYTASGKTEKFERMLKKGESWTLEINGNCEVSASAIGHVPSSTVAIFTKKENTFKVISIQGAYNKQYSGGGDDALVNGILGSEEWRSGDWQGYQNQDFEAVIDLGKLTTLNSIGARFLQDTRAWILMPKDVEYLVSKNGNDFVSVAKLGSFFADTILTTTVVPLNLEIQKQEARYVKVKAKNYGALPPWHQGYPFGGTAFIFIDEILINPPFVSELKH